jgi:uncharacterized cupredoxin-like copper-binding protein
MRIRTPKLMVAIFVGAIFAGPVAAQATDWSKAKRIDIAMANFNFTPSRIVLHHGDAYILHFTNAAKGGHNFMAKSFFSAAKVAPGDAARTIKGVVELDGGQSTDIRLIAPAAAIYEVHCSHFLHQSFGMKGEIAVE